MYTSFDGDYRRRPMQSLGGHSMSTNRDSIIKKSQEQRQKRSELRKQTASATQIQSYIRSFLTRKHTKSSERTNFDEFLRLRKNNLEANFDANEISYVLQRFVFFYDSGQDSDRLIFICKILVKHTKKIVELLEACPQWRYRLREICNICLQQLSTSSSGSHAIPMRIIEIYTDIKYSSSKQILLQLVEQRYFDKVRNILELKCPPLDGETIRPPDPTSEAVFDMIMRPLAFVAADTYSDICLKFSECFLSQKPSESISCFLIPTLSQPEQSLKFPFIKIIEALGEILPNSSDDCKMEVDLNLKSPKPENIFTSYLLKHILDLDRNLDLKDFSGYNVCSSYLGIMSHLSQHLLKLPKSAVKTKLMSLGALKFDMDDSSKDEYDSDSDSEETPTKNNDGDFFETGVLLDVVEFLYKPNRINWIFQHQIENFSDNPKQLYQISVFCHNFLLMSNFSTASNIELFNISNIPKFLRSLWFTLVNQSNQLGFNSPLALISKGVIPKADTDIERTIPFLATFCAIYSKRLPMMHDDDFSSKIDENPLPFSLNEIIHLCKILKEISLGLVELAFPETRTNLNNHYRNVLGHTEADNERIKQKQQVWAHLLNVVVCVINQLYNRDLRMNFCPEGAWVLENLNLTLDKDWDVPLVRARRGHRPFEPIKDFTRKDFDNGPPPSTKQLRSVTILREIPFVVSFARRVNILQGLIASDKMKIQGGLHAFLQGPAIHLSVRRSHLYEDSFDKLRPENEPELRHVMKIQFVSSLGLEEIGIDGGGVFREYINELLKTAFDPNRGFFMLTTDNKLYPNPNVADLVENYEKHYEFIGRILGKAIYENLRVELPLAECFLTKLAGRKYSTHDMHQLASLDPELYKHLLSLKSHKDIDTLGLDFSIVTSSFGNTQVKVHELKPGGQNILVSSHNINEYIGLVADFKLSKQIHKQCKAFRRGLSNLLPIEWLNMFSNKELQILISGTEIPIDLEDLKNNCRYGADYSPDHPTIKCFWRVVEEFDEDQKRQLLKFVTSSTRPPLNGFKDLEPPFSIQNTNDEDRLPTASTCTNLLKLPPFKNDETMREKLLYAIESGAGFELS